MPYCFKSQKTMISKKPFLKIVSLGVLFFFIFTDIARAVPPGGIVLSPTRETPSFLEIQIPKELASIEEIYEAPAKADPSLVMHIQNIHGNYEAQRQIKKLLGYLYEEYGFKLLFIEGAASELDREYLELFEKPENNLALADRLTREGQMNGVEYYLMDSPKDVRAVGIEDAKLYRQNYEDFKEVHQAENETKNFLQKVEQNLESVSSRIFSQETRRLLSEWRKFEAGHRDFLPYVKRLSQDAKKTLGLDLGSLFSQMEWPQLTRILVLQEMEKDLDLNAANQEKERVIEFLKQKRVSKEIISAIERLDEKRITLAKSEAVPAGRQESRKYEDVPRYLFEKLAQEAAPKGFYFYQYPAFSLWAGHIILKNELDSKELFKEINKIFEKILNELTITEKEKNLLELYRDANLLEKLLNLKLTREEWQRAVYREEWLKPGVIQTRITKLTESSLFGRGQPARRSAGGGEERNPHPPASAGIFSQREKGIAKLFTTAQSFYEIARQREDAFYETLRTEMKASETQKAVLVTGGFHTEGMMEKLREEEINYSVLMPKLKGTHLDQRNYIETMLETKPTMFDVGTIEYIGLLQDAMMRYEQGLYKPEEKGALIAEIEDLTQELKHVLQAFVEIGIYETWQEAAEAFNYFNGTKYSHNRKVRLNYQDRTLNIEVNGKSLTRYYEGKDGKLQANFIDIIVDQDKDGRIKAKGHLQKGAKVTSRSEGRAVTEEQIQQTREALVKLLEETRNTNVIGVLIAPFPGSEGLQLQLILEEGSLMMGRIDETQIQFDLIDRLDFVETGLMMPFALRDSLNEDNPSASFDSTVLMFLTPLASIPGIDIVSGSAYPTSQSQIQDWVVVGKDKESQQKIEEAISDSMNRVRSEEKPPERPFLNYSDAEYVSLILQNTDNRLRKFGVQSILEERQDALMNEAAFREPKALFSAIREALNEGGALEQYEEKSVGAMLVSAVLITLTASLKTFQSKPGEDPSSLLALTEEAYDLVDSLPRSPSPNYNDLISKALETIQEYKNDLGKIDDAKSEGRIDVGAVFLIDKLNSQNSSLFQSIASALVDQDPDFVAPALITALKDRNNFIRANVALILGMIGEKAAAAVPELRTALKSENDSLRQNAAWALNKMGGAAVAAAPDLIQALEDKNDAVYKAVRETLLNLVEEVANAEQTATIVAQLIQALEGKSIPKRDRAAKVLIEISPKTLPTVVHELRKALKEGSPLIRENVAWIIGMIGEGAVAAVPELKAALESENDSLRHNAAWALIKIGVAKSEGRAEKKSSPDERVLKYLRQQVNDPQIEIIVKISKQHKGSYEITVRPNKVAANTDEKLNAIIEKVKNALIQKEGTVSKVESGEGDNGTKWRGIVFTPKKKAQKKTLTQTERPPPKAAKPTTKSRAPLWVGLGVALSFGLIGALFFALSGDDDAPTIPHDGSVPTQPKDKTPTKDKKQPPKPKKDSKGKAKPSPKKAKEASSGKSSSIDPSKVAKSKPKSQGKRSPNLLARVRFGNYKGRGHFEDQKVTPFPVKSVRAGFALGGIGGIGPEGADLKLSDYDAIEVIYQNPSGTKKNSSVVLEFKQKTKFVDKVSVGLPPGKTKIVKPIDKDLLPKDSSFDHWGLVQGEGPAKIESVILISGNGNNVVLSIAKPEKFEDPKPEPPKPTPEEPRGQSKAPADIFDDVAAAKPGPTDPKLVSKGKPKKAKPVVVVKVISDKDRTKPLPEILETHRQKSMTILKQPMLENRGALRLTGFRSKPLIFLDRVDNTGKVFNPLTKFDARYTQPMIMGMQAHVFALQANGDAPRTVKDPLRELERLTIFFQEMQKKGQLINPLGAPSWLKRDANTGNIIFDTARTLSWEDLVQYDAHLIGAIDRLLVYASNPKHARSKKKALAIAKALYKLVEQNDAVYVKLYDGNTGLFYHDFNVAKGQPVINNLHADRIRTNETRTASTLRIALLVAKKKVPEKVITDVPLVIGKVDDVSVLVAYRSAFHHGQNNALPLDTRYPHMMDLRKSTGRVYIDKAKEGKGNKAFFPTPTYIRIKQYFDKGGILDLAEAGDANENVVSPLVAYMFVDKDVMNFMRTFMPTKPLFRNRRLGGLPFASPTAAVHGAEHYVPGYIAYARRGTTLRAFLDAVKIHGIQDDPDVKGDGLQEIIDSWYLDEKKRNWQDISGQPVKIIVPSKSESRTYDDYSDVEPGTLIEALVHARFGGVGSAKIIDSQIDKSFKTLQKQEIEDSTKAVLIGSFFGLTLSLLRESALNEFTLRFIQNLKETLLLWKDSSSDEDVLGIIDDHLEWLNENEDEEGLAATSKSEGRAKLSDNEIKQANQIQSYYGIGIAESTKVERWIQDQLFAAGDEELVAEVLDTLQSLRSRTIGYAELELNHVLEQSGKLRKDLIETEDALQIRSWLRRVIVFLGNPLKDYQAQNNNTGNEEVRPFESWVQDLSAQEIPGLPEYPLADYNNVVGLQSPTLDGGVVLLSGHETQLSWKSDLMVVSDMIREIDSTEAKERETRLWIRLFMELREIEWKLQTLEPDSDMRALIEEGIRDQLGPLTFDINEEQMSREFVKRVFYLGEALRRLGQRLEQEGEPVELRVDPKDPHSLAHQGRVAAVKFSPDERLIASVGEGGVMRVWDARTLTLLYDRNLKTSVNAVAFSPDGKRIATGDSKGYVTVWNAQTGERISRVSVKGTLGFLKKRSVWSVQFSPDGNHIASLSDAGEKDAYKYFQLDIWDAQTGEQTLRVVESTGSIFKKTPWHSEAMVFSPNGKWIFIALRDDDVHVRDAQTGAVLQDHDGLGRFLALSPDGRLLAAREDYVNNHRVVILELENNEHPSIGLGSPGQSPHAASVAFSHDGKYLVQGTEDGGVTAWEVQPSQPLFHLLEPNTLDHRAHQASVGSVAFSPDGKRVVSADNVGRIRVWGLRWSQPSAEPQEPLAIYRRASIISAHTEEDSLNSDSRLKRIFANFLGVVAATLLFFAILLPVFSFGATGYFIKKEKSTGLKIREDPNGQKAITWGGLGGAVPVDENSVYRTLNSAKSKLEVVRQKDGEGEFSHYQTSPNEAQDFLEFAAKKAAELEDPSISKRIKEIAERLPDVENQVTSRDRFNKNDTYISERAQISEIQEAVLGKAQTYYVELPSDWKQTYSFARSLGLGFGMLGIPLAFLSMYLLANGYLRRSFNFGQKLLQKPEQDSAVSQSESRVTDNATPAKSEGRGAAEIDGVIARTETRSFEEYDVLKLGFLLNHNLAIQFQLSTEKKRGHGKQLVKENIENIFKELKKRQNIESIVLFHLINLMEGHIEVHGEHVKQDPKYPSKILLSYMDKVKDLFEFWRTQEWVPLKDKERIEALLLKFPEIRQELLSKKTAKTEARILPEEVQKWITGIKNIEYDWKQPDFDSLLNVFAKEFEKDSIVTMALLQSLFQYEFEVSELLLEEIQDAEGQEGALYQKLINEIPRAIAFQQFIHFSTVQQDLSKIKFTLQEAVKNPRKIDSFILGTYLDLLQYVDQWHQHHDALLEANLSESSQKLRVRRNALTATLKRILEKRIRPERANIAARLKGSLFRKEGVTSEKSARSEIRFDDGVRLGQPRLEGVVKLPPIQKIIAIAGNLARLLSRSEILEKYAIALKDINLSDKARREIEAYQASQTLAPSKEFGAVRIKIPSGVPLTEELMRGLWLMMRGQEKQLTAIVFNAKDENYKATKTQVKAWLKKLNEDERIRQGLSEEVDVIERFIVEVTHSANRDRADRRIPSRMLAKAKQLNFVSSASEFHEHFVDFVVHTDVTQAKAGAEANQDYSLGLQIYLGSQDITQVIKLLTGTLVSMKRSQVVEAEELSEEQYRTLQKEEARLWQMVAQLLSGLEKGLAVDLATLEKVLAAA